MVASTSKYIWAQPGWPDLTARAEALTESLGNARLAPGTVPGLAHALGLESHPEIVHENRRGRRVAPPRGWPGGRDGRRHPQLRSELTHERLCNWKAALFPPGRSGLRRIETGTYRKHADPMQIVSGRQGKEKVHHEAPPSSQVHAEMTRFLAWFNASAPGAAIPVDGLVRAALAHLWFETIHPFEDGNGRLGRALADMALAQDTNAAVRLHSLSRRLHENRAQYYDALNAAQCGTLDATAWVVWFITQFEAACRQSASIMCAAVDKTHFWRSAPEMNERQKKVVQKLLDAEPEGFEGGMSAAKYVNITGASKPTATRDLADVAKRGVLAVVGQGRGTRYTLAK